MRLLLPLFVIPILFVENNAFSQNELSNDSTSNKIFREKSLFVLPVAFRYPETGWGGGVAATSSWTWAKDSVGSKPSQASIGVTYTQNKQILAFFPFSVFAKNNKFYFNSDIGWYRYNYYYYGVGENVVPEEIFDVDYLRIRFLASRQINAKTYVGLRLNLEPYNVTGTEEGGELSSGKIFGSNDSRTSALGLAILRDTRDNVFYPRKGLFGEFSILPSTKLFGSNVEFLQLNLDLAKYASLSEKVVSASHIYAMNNFGKNVPFNQLALIGGAKRMRGIYYGYFRDKNAVILQEELRWEVWRFIGLVGFGAVTFMGDEVDYLRLTKPKFTYGAGLRIATKNHLNLRLDYGLSPYGSGNFYATIGEAF
ncbi:Surface antigen [Spirosomataceae bacterium TFI 002]|nr:Surface antigen [Spirosomataceae bacterium TFI 002]